MIRRVDLFIDSPNGRGQLFALSGFLPPTPLQSGGSVSVTQRALAGELPEDPDEAEDPASGDGNPAEPANPLDPLSPLIDENGRR